MNEAAVVFGFVILVLASAWTIFKAIQIIGRAKTKTELNEAGAYLIAFAFLALFTYRLMLSLP